MDPDATLETLRQLCADYENGITNSAKLLQEFFEAFTALDAWLDGGGFLPKDWTYDR